VTVLSFSDIERVNSAIADIYAVRDPGDFFQQIVPLLKDLLSSAIGSYNEFDSENRLLSVVNDSRDHDEVFRNHQEAAREYIPTHPVFGISLSNRCTLTSDIMEPSAFLKTPLYNEYYRHLDVQSQLLTELPIPQGMRRFLAFGRAKPCFSERERFLLNLIKPHIIQAYRNVLELQHYREKIALFEQGDDFPALRQLGLTDREATVLGWAAKGKTNGDIALILGISRRTVEKHFERIYEKLGVETKIAAVSVVVGTSFARAHAASESEAR
jgi:DNA-binding CsgD family transcriptional regulator